MKRKTKNILMFVVIIVVIGLTIFTIFQAKNGSQNMSSNMPQMNEQNENPMENNDGNMQSPPEKPEGEQSENIQSPPEKPEGEQSGNMQDGTPSEMPNGKFNGNSITTELKAKYYIIFGIESLVISVIAIYLLMSKFNKKTFKETFASSNKLVIMIFSTLIITGALTYGETLIAKSNVNTNNQNNNISYSSKNEITENKEITNGEFTSSESDENSILVNGDIDVDLSNIKVTKTGDSKGGDNTSFYGMNSSILAKGGAVLNIDNVTIETNATGANGVFSYGGSATTNNTNNDGTTINISNSKIITKKDNSGGIMTTGGGITKANNLEIETAGTSSAAIRSDRGGGKVNVDGGTYKTTGQGSPAIYSTADITVKNATLISKTSEGAIIEGKNTITLENVILTDTNNKLNGQSTTYKNVFLYQSMSGDAVTGTSVFTAKKSTITTNKGDSLYITNTSVTINLEENEIVNNDKDGNFLRAQKDSWGNSGTNGGNVILNMTNQNIMGNIVIDSISTLEMYMNKSLYEGTINSSNEAKSITLKLDKTSKIKLTGDSYITFIDNADKNNSNIDFNGYKLYVNKKAIN